VFPEPEIHFHGSFLSLIDSVLSGMQINVILLSLEFANYSSEVLEPNS